MTAIELRGIEKAYGDKSVLSNLDMTVEEGVKLVISGGVVEPPMDGREPPPTDT